MAKVLNGEVWAGDRVAYATREGNRAGIHLGRVVAVVPYEGRQYNRDTGKYETVTKYKLKVEIEAETSHWRGSRRTRVVEHLDRVVKL
jgi:hypothetical protein